MESSVALIVVGLNVVISAVFSLYLFLISRLQTNKERYTSVYFSLVFFCIALATVGLMAREQIGFWFSLLLTHVMYLGGAYCLYHGFLWRKGLQKHLHGNPWFWRHLAVYLFLQVALFGYWYDSITMRSILVVLNLGLVTWFVTQNLSINNDGLSLGESVTRATQYAAILMMMSVPFVSGFLSPQGTIIYSYGVASTLLILVFSSLIFLMVHDLSEDHRRSSITDTLTQLFNRRYFFQRLSESFSDAQRHGQPLSIIICDLDHFKQINDTYGHAAGDRALQVVSDVLKQQIRNFDVVARFGGEEFIFLLPQTDGDDACQLAERMRVATEGKKVVGDRHSFSITASFGVVQCDTGVSMEENVSGADQALYRAKSLGRNRVECFW